MDGIEFMKIKTITEINPEVFDMEVNKLLKQGWRFHGNPYIKTLDHVRYDGEHELVTRFTQVMVYNSN
jgi:hypothetical protein